MKQNYFLSCWSTTKYSKPFVNIIISFSNLTGLRPDFHVHWDSNEIIGTLKYLHGIGKVIVNYQFVHSLNINELGYQKVGTVSLKQNQNHFSNSSFVDKLTNTIKAIIIIMHKDETWAYISRFNVYMIRGYREVRGWLPQSYMLRPVAAAFLQTTVPNRRANRYIFCVLWYDL